VTCLYYEKNVLREVRDKAEETADEVKITTDAHSALCEVQAEAEKNAKYLNITREYDRF
jgi:hypothetical protein